MTQEKIISTTHCKNETVQILERITFEKSNGQTTKIIRRVRRVTQNVPERVIKRKGLPKFGLATNPGNDSVTYRGPEVFIEKYPYERRSKISETNNQSTKPEISKWLTSLEPRKSKEEVTKGYSGWLKKSRDDKVDEKWKRSLFVTNIPPDVDRNEAQEYIRSISNQVPSRVCVIRNRTTGICHGNMIVDFRTIESANKCMSDLHGQTWGRNIIHAQISKPKESR